MPTGNAVDFRYFRYTDDDGVFWSVKSDRDWGANAQSGLGAFNAADQAWPHSGRYRMRKCILQDPVSGRTTQRPLGTSGAAAGVRGTAVVTVARGAGGSYTLTSLGRTNERKPRTGAIINKAEPITT